MKSVGGLAGEALGGALGEPGTGTRDKKTRGRGNGKARGNGAAKGERSSARAKTGRLERSGQEKVLEPGALAENMTDMLGLYGKLQQAQVAFSEKVKGVAERTGHLASTVRSVVVAHSKGDEVVADRRRAAEQLSLAFDAVGEA